MSASAGQTSVISAELLLRVDEILHSRDGRSRFAMPGIGEVRSAVRNLTKQLGRHNHTKRPRPNKGPKGRQNSPQEASKLRLKSTHNRPPLH